MEPNRRKLDEDDKPVRYTSETGEEFFVEFMRDRVNINIKSNDPNVAWDGLLLDAGMGIFRTQEVGMFENNPWVQSSSGLSLENVKTSTVQVIKNEDIEETRKLGSGTFATVYHGRWRGADVAIKRIKDSSRLSKQEMQAMESSEVEILSTLQHPNIVAFYGVVEDGPGSVVATVSEYMVDGSLRDALRRNNGYFNSQKKLIVAMHTAFGMEYLHSKSVVHYDLKCENLLVNLGDPLRPICKIGDFGLAKFKRRTLLSRGDGMRGTLPWMAPELLGREKVSEKIDVFSFGIVLWEILSGGEEPYANLHHGAILGGIALGGLRPTIPSDWDSEWKTLMKECWAQDPQARPSFRDIATRLRRMFTTATTRRN